MSIVTANEITRLMDLSPSPYHVVENLAQYLSQQGFQRLTEVDSWSLQGGGRYFLSRQGSALLAFVMPESVTQPAPLRLCSSHTDSPTLKLKPALLKRKGGYWVFDVAVYGSPILSTWFDRDLSMAGLVSGLDEKGGLHHTVFHLGKPITRIPNLAIHL
ncbi:MAG: M18 family aminopeptidase, partial [Magnetococcales bacterium]|nr:M18 family aminopeptidase [Magnetococcales bacterium]NGZ29221.1 M18 family aminopeptidase [Magnetococcales bacterium]